MPLSSYTGGMIDAPKTVPSYELIALLGRQPELSLAELEQVFRADDLKKFGPDTATLTLSEDFDIQRIGGTIKAGKVLKRINATDWSTLGKKIVETCVSTFAHGEGKLTLGISVYGHGVAPRDVQKLGLTIKSKLKPTRSVRLIPNDGSALSSATSHHNKLGLSENKVEILVVFGKRETILAQSVGTQNITALAARDQARPMTDAFVGMLPPKLALMMVNLSGAYHSGNDATAILDPFCGTGVVLQEALLLGFDAIGTDLSEKMVDYSRVNMEWLGGLNRYSYFIEHGDATEHTWTTSRTVAAVVSETYLGQPFSAPPAPDKLQKVVRITNDIISKFLRNLAGQIETGTPLCLAVPAWRDEHGNVTYLPLLHDIEKLGYSWQPLRTTDEKHLLYYRDDQVVARQLLLLKKK